MAGQKKVYLKDVAKEAGVSTALVSYVLNGRHTNRINADTAERIKAVATRLNYQPDFLAKALKSQKTKTIGLILADLANPFSAQLARILEDELSPHGYLTIIGSTDESNTKFKELVNAFSNRKVDGLILVPPAHAEQEVTRIHAMDTPYVLVDRYFPNAPFNYIINDNHYATYSAAKQLVRAGKRHIGLITAEMGLAHLEDRKLGFVAACQEENLPYEGRIKAVEGAFLAKEVEYAINQLREECPPLDALLFTTNVLTLHGLKYAIKHRIRAPQDLALMAIDEAPYYDVFPSPIPYYKQPLEAMGRKAVQFLLTQMKTADVQTVQERLRGELILRTVAQEV